MTKITDVEFKGDDLFEKENTELKMRIVDLLKENNILKKQLEVARSSESLMVNQPNSPILDVNSRYIGASDEETICRMQLEILNKVSMMRELSMEETKKVDIYTKLLIQINSGKKSKPDSGLDSLTDNDLLRIVADIGN